MNVCTRTTCGRRYLPKRQDAGEKVRQPNAADCRRATTYIKSNGEKLNFEQAWLAIHAERRTLFESFSMTEGQTYNWHPGQLAAVEGSSSNYFCCRVVLASVSAMLGSVARSARRLLPANASGARCFGIASAVPPETTLMAFTAADEADISLRMSLAADRLTTRGDAVRNPDLRVLLQQLPRGVEISKSRVVRSTGAAAAAAPVVRATDAINGAGAVADVEEFEAELADVVDNRLSFAPMLFVQDGAMGASRSTEIRTRVITDSPLTALAARALLHRVPLYNAQVFPRTITVYAATRQYVSFACSIAMWLVCAHLHRPE